MGVRTIQRYETKLGLPVQRVAGPNPSALLAFCDEIDQWLSTSPTRSNLRAARACDVFSSLLEELQRHTASCPHCAGTREFTRDDQSPSVIQPTNSQQEDGGLLKTVRLVAQRAA